MQIGELAKRSGVSAKMIRHYEDIGLIAAAGRRANSYRDYSERDVHELRFVRRARDLGFSLEEIKALLDLWRDKRRQSREVRALAARHLADIDRRIADLQRIAGTLRGLIASCHGDHRPDCPILDELAPPTPPGSPPSRTARSGCSASPSTGTPDSSAGT